MALLNYTVTRNVDATKPDGTKCKIALASVIHENGMGETVAIPEDLIRFAGEDIIDVEVRKAVGR